MRAVKRFSTAAIVAALVVLLVGLAGPPAGPVQARVEPASIAAPAPGDIPMGPPVPQAEGPSAGEIVGRMLKLSV